MQFTAEQKSQLAKLMATENITVQHSKIPTARFDTANRVLYLPIWQDMTGVIYDLFCGHEVGHALYTPPEGWHTAVSNNAKGKNYKSFLNVVEDARIEKKVKRKYPGLSTSFKNAYAELVARNLFGTKDKDINTMAFIDRLNLFSKSQWTSNINFSEEELIMVKKVQNVESWEDVLRVTDEIFEYSKNEQFEYHYEEYSFSELSQDELDGDYDFDTESKSDNDGESGENENDSTNMPGEKTNSDEDADNSKNVKGKNDGDEDSDEFDSDENGTSTNPWKDSKESQYDQFNPNCVTDDTFRHNETTLLDEQSKNYDYLQFPKPILENIITPAKTVHEALNKFYKQCVTEGYLFSDTSQKLLNEFKMKNEKYIGLLAKEFEMRKAAKSFSKSKLSDTGDIDVNKLASYKFDDNIFRKVMLTPKGKSHGLILLLDKSGSMSNNMAGSIEQIMVLALFCRKVNIPFVVYGFGDSEEALMIDRGFNINDNGDYRKFRETNNKTFESKVNQVNFSNVRLREYLNSNMNNVEFTSALKNMVLVKKSFEGGRYNREVPRAPSEELSNTPLTQAIIASVDIMKTFKKKNNLDLTSLIIVHDGDADWCNRKTVEMDENEFNQNKTILTDRSIDNWNNNVFVVDPKIKFQQKMDNSRDTMNNIALQYFRKATGSKVFGFFILANTHGNIRSAIRNHYCSAEGEKIEEIYQKNYENGELITKKITKQIRDEKYLISYKSGFDAFYLISGGDELKTEDDEIEIDGKITSSKLTKAFMKMNKKKQINRVLVSKFIQGIAA